MKHKIIKKEATALIEPELSSQSEVSLTASAISISNRLNYVNSSILYT